MSSSSQHVAAHNGTMHGTKQRIISLLLAVIWDALKAACESDLPTAQLIVNSAGVIVTVPDLSTCFDERGDPARLTCMLQQPQKALQLVAAEMLLLIQHSVLDKCNA